MKKILKTTSYIIIAVLIGVTVTYAGTLTPPGSPAKSMKSLSDLYELVNTGDNTPNTDFTTPSTVASTMTSIGDVYDTLKTKITDIDSTKILTGTTIFGKAGSASAGGANLFNMWNGSCGNGANACPSGEFTGGSQSNGGVDDANYDSNWVPQTPPANRYQTDWTTCNIGNNYCGTGDSGANAKDESTGLIWSYPLKNTNCVEGVCESYADFDTAPADLTGCDTGNCAYWDTDTYYSWDNSRQDNNNMTAQQLCQSKGANWYLPHQKQLMQAYIDGAYGNGNLDTIGVDRLYWSSTTYSSSADGAWYVNMTNGYTGSKYKGSSYVVRCVQE